MFIVYGREYCKYCRMAKKLLSTKSYEFKYFDLDEIDVDGSFLEKLKCEFSMTTIPIIFYIENNCETGDMDGLSGSDEVDSENIDEELLKTFKLVGGYTELVDFIEKIKLIC